MQGMKTRKMSLQTKQNLIGWLFILPAVLLIACLSFYPAIQALITSFKSGVGVKMTWVGLYNYLRIFKDKVFLQSLKNCFFYLIIQVPVMLVL